MKMAIVAVATLLFMVIIGQAIPEAAQNALEGMTGEFMNKPS